MDTFNKLLVINGNLVSVVDMSGLELSCSAPSGLPGDVQAQYGTGAFYNNASLFCGSWITEFQNSCYQLDTWNGSWIKISEMSVGRYDAASVLIDPTTFWITGGYSSDYGKLNSTEKLAVGVGSFQRDLDLPEQMDNHCFLQIDENTYFLHAENGKTWLLDYASNNWTQVGDIPLEREYPICGKAESSALGTIVVVTGGEFDITLLDLTYVYSISLSAWDVGPSLPTALRGAESVQFGDSFLVLGGFNGTGYQDDIYEFDPEGMRWRQRQEKLSSTGFGLVAMIAPDYFTNCS